MNRTSSLLIGYAKEWGFVRNRLRLMLVLGFMALSLPVASLTLQEAELAFQAAKTNLDACPKDVEAGWKFSATCFRRAEFARNNPERAKYAELGIAAAREVIRLSSNSVQGRFYLAVNLGQLARTRMLSALGMVSEMERQFLAAIAIDPKFNHASPERSLGMLYLEAPGWPTSVGSRSKARVHLQRAVELEPDYAENWLTLMEAEIGWGEKKKVQARLADIDKMLERAKPLVMGAEGEAGWKDVEARVGKLKQQAYGHPASPAHGSAKR